MARRLVRADLHSHTYYSPDSIVSPQRLVQECLRRGIDCLAVTDHNTIAGAQAVKELALIKVIVGEEIRTVGGEIMGLFLREEVPAGLSPEESVERVKAQGGLVGIPHPFDRQRGALKEEAILRVLPQIDFVETFNARIVFASANRRASLFAQEQGLAASAGSDAHSPWEVGRAHVEMADFDGVQSFLAALRQGRVIGQLSSFLVHFWSRWAWLRHRLGWRPV
jgi:predicted metal-dependent phosphoesterase TrpH